MPKPALPRTGLLYSEKSSLGEVLCKPRIIAIKSDSLKRLETLEKELLQAPDSLANGE